MRAMPRLRSGRFGRGAALTGALTAAVLGVSMTAASAAAVQAHDDSGTIGPTDVPFSYSTVVNVLSNDKDGDGNDATISTVEVSLPNDDADPDPTVYDTGKGLAVLDPATGDIEYTAYNPDDPTGTLPPDPSTFPYCNPEFDTFWYDLSSTDPDNPSTDQGRVTINLASTVVDIMAYDDAVPGAKNAPAEGDVLTNDCDQENNTPALPENVAAELDGSEPLPTNGTVVLNPDGTFVYTPNPDFVGEDTFYYIIRTTDDGAERISCAKVVITVEDRTTPPSTTPPPATTPPTTTPTTSAAPALAVTGSSSTIPLVITGGALLLVGVGFAVFARRRKGAEHQ